MDYNNNSVLFYRGSFATAKPVFACVAEAGDPPFRDCRPAVLSRRKNRFIFGCKPEVPRCFFYVSLWVILTARVQARNILRKEPAVGV